MREAMRLTATTPLTGKYRPDSSLRLNHPCSLPNGQPWPTISIITPSYNQGRFLEDMIQSVIDQEYPAIEHIIVDGGSTDETLQIMKHYQNHFAYSISEPDKGQSDALNKGFRLASGEIFTWLNCDDQLAPGALFAVALSFYYSNSDMVAGGCRVFSECGTEQLYHVTACDNGVLPLEDLLDVENCWLAGQFFFQPEVMFTRALWERAGGYIEENLYYCMDYELWTRFAVHGAKLHVICSPVAHYRLHAAQKTSTIEAFRPELNDTAAWLKGKYNIPVRPSQEPLLHRKQIRIVFASACSADSLAAIQLSKIALACSLAGHSVIFLDVNQEDLAPIVSLNPDLVVVGDISDLSDASLYISKMSSKWSVICVFDTGVLQSMQTGSSSPLSMNTMHCLHASFAAMDTDKECSLLSIYRDFILKLRKTGLLSQLGMLPTIEFQGNRSCKSKLNLVISNPDAKHHAYDKLGMFYTSFTEWFDMLLPCEKKELQLAEKEKLLQTIGNRKLIVFGAGGLYQNNLKPILGSLNIRPVFIIDNDPTKAESCLDGIVIHSPEALRAIDMNEHYILIASMYYTEIKVQLRQYGLVEYQHFIKAG